MLSGLTPREKPLAYSVRTSPPSRQRKSITSAPLVLGIGSARKSVEDALQGRGEKNRLEVSAP